MRRLFFAARMTMIFSLRNLWTSAAAWAGGNDPRAVAIKHL